jgi:hypothetical protein
MNLNQTISTTRSEFDRILCKERSMFHSKLIKCSLSSKGGIPVFADVGNKASIEIARRLVAKLGQSVTAARVAGQTSGNEFEGACCDFITATFKKLGHLRPGKWQVVRLPQRDRVGIARFEQYSHLSEIARMCKENTELATVIGSDYLICPDIVIFRDLEEDNEINRHENLVDDKTANRASLRKSNGGKPIIHASISCKWTIRSDRVQNSRAEALNLMRNRKGHLPHIVVLTAEPLPSRLASIALGTGDIDTIYHFALPELIESVSEINSPDSSEMMRIMLEGKRLRDISDLPLDLAV